ncbi:hypothetical protein AXG93_2587s1720 [Marchantia polymorpha subsp. ruderalis]|uniref:Uncharacterized protein n=1 Tax=Marchantia polymorpha subsp. ruderalis TaxID=1480154 RepID=A0A176WT24_MARPO|nr:hypothetical protein AXG93_2587s1720 [Marchantia polymorpha subsp. ruderalis]
MRIVEDFYGDRDPRDRRRHAFGGGGSGVGASHTDRGALRKKALQLRDDVMANAQREIEEQRARVETELNSERAQNRILAEELVRHTRTMEKSETARKADEELLGRLQSQCDESRAQRAEAELQLAEVEGHIRRATDRTREELVSRVDRCLRGYVCWEIAARERMTLREMEIRAAALMSGDSRSRRRVVKRWISFLSRSRDAIANLEAEVTAVLRRLGLRRRADMWTGREIVMCVTLLEAPSGVASAVFLGMTSA